MKVDSSTDPKHSDGSGALLTGGVAAILASACCLGPLILIMLGVSGAWISSLTLLEPYRPLFIGAAVLALFFAYRRIWQPVASCDVGQFCATPRINRVFKALFWVVVMLVFIALGFPLIAHWFY